jgi:hypothetical protein
LIEAVSLRSAWLISRACRPGWLVAHLAFELGARHQRRDRIDHQHVDRAGAHQRVGDLERLLAVVGLRDQKIVDVDAELPGIDRVERVLGIDEGADAALLLRLGDGVQSQRGLAGRFGPVDLDHPAARQAADAERDIEAERAGGARYRSSIDLSFLPSFMIEPLPKLRSIWESAASRAFDLIHGGTFDETQCGSGHSTHSLRRIRETDKRRSGEDSMYTICSRFAICSFWGGGGGIIP